MTVQYDIDSFFQGLHSERLRLTNLLNAFKMALVKDGVINVGARVYRDAAATAWQLDAVTYVLGSEKDVVDLPTFRMLAESLQRDLITNGGQRFGSEYRSDPAYWQTLGGIEQEATRLVARASVRERV